MTEAGTFHVVVCESGVELNDYIDDIASFVRLFDPLEKNNLTLLKDQRTAAVFIECHIPASKITNLGTTDVPLDADASAEYRANRDVVADHAAFEQMRNDALEGRRFSNIVAEFVEGEQLPLKIIGGQHRFEAIKEAHDEGIEIEHGVKVYLQLDNEQRLDVQIISNTNISVSKELLDRMYETLAGAELREWCQKCGLLERKQDFADKPGRGNPITVKEARSFICNYYLGKAIPSNEFPVRDTTPQLVESGKRDPKIWKDTKQTNPDLWNDKKLQAAGKSFAELRTAQMKSFLDQKTGKYIGPADFRHKAKNLALLAGWAFVAGCLSDNPTRLKRHYSLPEKGKSKDPLRADLLANGRHSTDPANYRGLGYRSDPKERGRFAELFWLQAENGAGITKGGIELAIQEYEAKQANLRAKAMREKLK
ncbi:hypothetical protein [Roseinatronobacter sp. S2]|uniref:hypothetical protein n=1 Tax=Roseinatronobacter sp. S2 TaxID=3035471 RepID=UPI00240EFF93|nr:hypothetical protein [Roseinatronobacter sp. S2]WFE75748.1 hypothetical protein P8S53_04885 [Roseinatronobacter sp. S2]